MTFKLNSLENIVGNGIQVFSTMVPLVDQDNSLRLSRTKKIDANFFNINEFTTVSSRKELILCKKYREFNDPAK